MAYFTDMLAQRRDTMGKHESFEHTVYEVLAEADRQHFEREQALRCRFYRLVKTCPENGYTGPPMLIPVHRDSVSYSYDMADCNDGEVEPYWYLDDDGKLYEVTCGPQERDADFKWEDDNSVIFAHSDLVANGKVVGHVSYTDH